MSLSITIWPTKMPVSVSFTIQSSILLSRLTPPASKFGMQPMVVFRKSSQISLPLILLASVWMIVSVSYSLEIREAELTVSMSRMEWRRSDSRNLAIAREKKLKPDHVARSKSRIKTSQV